MKRNRCFYQFSGLFLILIMVLVISGCSTVNNSSKTNATVEITSTVVIDDANNGHGNDVDGCDESNPGNGDQCAATATPVTTNNNGQGKK